MRTPVPRTAEQMLSRMNNTVTVPMRHVELLFDSLNRAAVAAHVIIHQMDSLERAAQNTRDHIREEAVLLEETKEVLRHMLQM